MRQGGSAEEETESIGRLCLACVMLRALHHGLLTPQQPTRSLVVMPILRRDLEKVTCLKSCIVEAEI